MKNKLRMEVEKLTDILIQHKDSNKDLYVEMFDTESALKFKLIITDHIIPLVKETSNVIGRAGCSLNYYSNELAMIRDPKKRIFIQILFYPYGHSKVTLGVNAPFLQFAYSPVKENIKITRKLSIKSDEARFKVDELEIDEFAEEKIYNYMLEFLQDVIKYNT